MHVDNENKSNKGLEKRIRKIKIREVKEWIIKELGFHDCWS